MSESFTLKPVTFPPEVLARISPDLSLQRHLSLGIRPCLRSFEEFKSVQVNSKLDSINRYGSSAVNPRSTTLGSSNVKSGNTIVFCQINGGFIEEFLPNDEVDENVKEYEKIYDQSGKNSNNDGNNPAGGDLANYRTVHPIVEIERGKSGPPTDEEMILSQALHDTILNAKIIPKESLDINLGLKTLDNDNKEVIVYPQDQDASTRDDGNLNILDFKTSKKFSFVLYASIQVFSRSGPLFDTVWLALITALKSTRLPFVYYDEKNSNLLHDLSSLSNKNSVKNGTVTAKSNLQVVCDPYKSAPLQLREQDSYATTFGLINLNKEFKVAAENLDDETLQKMQIDGEPNEDAPILLCDIEGDAEENAVDSRISVITNKNSVDQNSKDNLISVSIVGGSTKITKEVIQKSIKLARLRSQYLEQQ